MERLCDDLSCQGGLYNEPSVDEEEEEEAEEENDNPDAPADSTTSNGWVPMDFPLVASLTIFIA